MSDREKMNQEASEAFQSMMESCSQLVRLIVAYTVLIKTLKAKGILTDEEINAMHAEIYEREIEMYVTYEAMMSGTAH